jgi:hypothetical protein
LGINNTTILIFDFLKKSKKPFLGKKALQFLEVLFIFLAVWTGLEPATPCVTGMYSNQLNYQTSAFFTFSL